MRARSACATGTRRSRPSPSPPTSSATRDSAPWSGAGTDPSRAELSAGVGERRRHRLLVVVDQLLGHERLHHLREALVGDQEPLGAVLVHLAERGCAAVPLRQPCEHPLARLFEIRLLPLLGHWLGHRPPPRRRYRHPALTAIRRMLGKIGRA